mgnify:CR=1 FL=1
MVGRRIRMKIIRKGQKMKLTDSITTLKGIGDKTAALFHKLNIYTLEDLVRHYPRDYEEYEAPVGIRFVKKEQINSLRVTIKRVEGVKRVRNLQILSVVAGDSENSIFLTWFNMPYLKSKLRSGETIIVRGIPSMKNGRLTMEQPELFLEGEYQKKQGLLLPKYPLTKGLTNKFMVNTLHQILEDREMVQEYLPEEFRNHYQLAEYNYAVSHIHFPTDREDLLLGHKRLVFDEFLFFILSVRMMKEQNADVGELVSRLQLSFD